MATASLRYLRGLNTPRIILWSYLLWYLWVLARHFDASPSLWINSLGISAIIGTGLYLSTSFAGTTRTRLEPWQVFRLYLMPLCVSSFAALIKGKGFVLIFHPTLRDNAFGFAMIGGFVGLVLLVRARARPRASDLVRMAHDCHRAPARD
jgi:hypothetical protein